MMKRLTQPRGRVSARPVNISTRRSVADSLRGSAAFVCLKAASLCLCAVVLLSAGPVVGRSSAQDLDDVTFAGRVTDETGAAIPGARVTAVHGQTKRAREVLTDGEGRFRVVELEPGAYTLRAAAEGFASEEKTNLQAVAGRRVALDFTLRPAGVSAETTVVGEADAPPVDTTRTVVGATLTREEIEQLPAPSRSPLELIFTLGGVTEEPLSTRDAAEDRDPSARTGTARHASTPEEAGAFSLSGGAAYANNVTVDGLDNNDDRAARERFQPSLEAVEEVQVVANQFSAEYGRASGGRVNLRTRSGSERFRGRLFHFFRDESLDANTFNNNRRGLKRLPLQRHDVGATLGGPLPLPRFGEGGRALDTSRAFFFAAYERQATLDSSLVDALVPVGQNPRFPLPRPTTLDGRRFETPTNPARGAAELAPFVERVSTPSVNHALTLRVDGRFGDAHNGTFLLQVGRSRNLRQFGGGLRLAESLQGRRRDTEALAYTHNHVLSATLVQQLRVQFSRLAPSLTARDANNRPVVLINIEDPLGERSGTLVAGDSSAGASRRRETRWQLQNSWTILRGGHTVKLGGDAQRVESVFTDLADASGTFDFASAADFLAGTPSRFRQRFGTESVQRNFYAGLFAQDEWRVRDRLHVTLGLRYERESILGDGDNWGPRLAAAYDPAGTGRTVLRFGAGRFFDRVLLRTVDDFTLGKQVVEFDTNALPAAERRAVLDAHVVFPHALAPDSEAVGRFGARPADFSRRLDPALRVPESYQFNLGFERELGRGLVVESNLTYNRGAHLWRELNANAPVLPRGFTDFAAYLLSRDFPNFRDATGARPVYNAVSAGELVRFSGAGAGANAADSIARVVEFGIPVSVFNLNSVNSAAALEAALAALAPLRPDPTRVQVEQLVSAGNSFYKALTVEARRRYARRDRVAFSLRAAYTLSRLIDDGVVNTSSALRVGDFRGERARSLLDRRHRFALSGVFDAPRAVPVLGGLRLAPVLRLASGAPFNLTLAGSDRNLDDVSNDRPSFHGDLRLLRARRPGDPLDPRLLAALSLPAVGTAGNLPRNAARGPASFLFDLSLTREFRLSERVRLRASAEFDNVLNKTVFTFGAEFVNFNALRPDPTPEQRRSLQETFLVPTRTLRPRSVRLGLRLDF
ncbi:MAG TPA: TonB-dependent receptor [Pyrinomonadaceae bacterium]|nr:TonB-dependent receptor [Pyrinomonadaceae bacterium]